MMTRGKLREVLRDIQHLTQMGCHNEARVVLAVALNRHNEAKILTCMDFIQSVEKGLPRSLESYRGIITDRLLRHVREQEGPQVADKILRALTSKEEHQ